MADAKKEEAPWPFKYESKLKYKANDSIEKHLDSFVEYNKADVQREITNMNLMLTDLVYDSAKAAMSDAKVFKGATKHGKHPHVVHLKDYKGQEKRDKAHSIIEKIVKSTAAEAYREAGKELDAKAAEAHAKSILSDHASLDRHLRAYAGIDYHSLVEALVNSDNILAGLKGLGDRNSEHDQALAKFLGTYVSQLNRLQSAHRLRLQHIEKSYPDFKKEIHAYTDKKADELGFEIDKGAGLDARLQLLGQYVQQQSAKELPLGEKNIKPKPKPKK